MKKSFYYISLLLSITFISATFIKADITGKIPIVRLATKSTQLLYYTIMEFYYSEYSAADSDSYDEKRAQAYGEKATIIGKWFVANKDKPDVKAYLTILEAALMQMLKLLPKNFINPGPFRSI